MLKLKSLISENNNHKHFDDDRLFFLKNNIYYSTLPILSLKEYPKIITLESGYINPLTFLRTKIKFDSAEYIETNNPKIKLVIRKKGGKVF